MTTPANPRTGKARVSRWPWWSRSRRMAASTASPATNPLVYRVENTTPGTRINSSPIPRPKRRKKARPTGSKGCSATANRSRTRPFTVWPREGQPPLPRFVRGDGPRAKHRRAGKTSRSVRGISCVGEHPPAELTPCFIPWSVSPPFSVILSGARSAQSKDLLPPEASIGFKSARAYVLRSVCRRPEVPSTPARGLAPLRMTEFKRQNLSAGVMLFDPKLFP